MRILKSTRSVTARLRWPFGDRQLFVGPTSARRTGVVSVRRCAVDRLFDNHPGYACEGLAVSKVRAETSVV